MDPGSEASQGDKDGVWKDVTYGPLRCPDVPLYDSVVNSHAHGLSFSPTLMVVYTHVETVDRPKTFSIRFTVSYDKVEGNESPSCGAC
jgi:hypothetical protein